MRSLIPPTLPCIESLEARLLLSDIEMNPVSHIDLFADAYVEESELGEMQAGSLPTSYDLRPSYVTSVKNQGAAGPAGPSPPTVLWKAAS